ncbi:hypothetical protein V6Z11_A10G101000 [Gossypium hirsutum]
MLEKRFYYFSLEELPMSVTFLISFSRDVFSSIQSETIMQKSCRAFSSGDIMILINFLNDIYFAEAFYHFSVIVLF